MPGGTTGTANQEVVVGRASAPVTVTLYEDLQCPICREFEQSEPTLEVDGTVPQNRTPAGLSAAITAAAKGR